MIHMITVGVEATDVDEAYSTLERACAGRLDLVFPSDKPDYEDDAMFTCPECGAVMLAWKEPQHECGDEFADCSYRA
jgi:hypothetical protein